MRIGFRLISFNIGENSTIQYRGEFHDRVRDDLASYLRKQGAIVETEIPLHLLGPAPVRAVLDILVQNPTTNALYGVEIKTGFDSKFSEEQEIVYPTQAPAAW
jgi:hypothetical protein